MAPATRSLRRDKVESLVDSTEAAADQLINGDSSNLETSDDLDEYYLRRELERESEGSMTRNSKLARSMPADSGRAPRSQSTMPDLLRFPVVVILTSVMSGLAYSLRASYLDGGELGRVSRSQEGWDDFGILFTWRTLELALGWFGNYDGYDLAALSVLSRGPPLYLLGTFYEVSLKTVLTSLLIDTLTTYIPFRLLRPLSPAHADSPSVPNRDITSDIPVQVITTLLAASIYSVTLYCAYMSYLPVYLATYFEGIPSIAAAYSATPTSLLPVTFLLGLATRSFIFTPATATKPSDSKAEPFNPETATLEETIWYNFWGWSKKTKLIIKRTATLMMVTGVNTFVQLYVTLEGVEALGAVAYSSVWIVAAGICGAVLGAGRVRRK
ncbi:hypothetical protein SS1G_07348 [Sclerotinia sclerotiorum 1980 UF-70]|uniref:Uncharacterized protein n=1 Tax=Sclerotinia sclerotiorum (strain ATCC 18683 / 1980 / Ss-1) TaxID=665079 RepID=A7EPU9_SCLS1|nr:hypothetical protein SS1G_07348 [Sclerotinia sclerotiorum 1980 UF-70]EDO04865.1 hypothetical protein SS1G_07348 [Sclerotinia sclerotiorum 1980 UF-70]